MRPEDDQYHTPVLAGEVLALLAPREGETMVDCTLGGGGHAEALLGQGAHVIGIDQDPEAIAFATKEKRLHRYGRSFHPVQANFAELSAVLDECGVRQVGGILMDLGVSSWQLDTAGRGFSFMRDGPLDMRMNPGAGQTAADIVNTAEPAELARIFYQYGEEPSSRRIVTQIANMRERTPFRTTMQLALAIEAVAPRRGRTHPATRVFQALRIAVNRELEVLERALGEAAVRLAPGGRLAVITFHSLEDRIVKDFFKLRSTPELDRPEWPAPRPNPDCVFELLTRKPIAASEAEQARNPRSRSAKLRGVRKLAQS